MNRAYPLQDITDTLLQTPPARVEKKQPVQEQVSCILPFYNEGSRLFQVLESICEIPYLKEIICVDDGSSDHIGHLIKTHLPWIKLLSLPANEGKAAAVRQGLRLATSELILLIDADLHGIKKTEIENSIKAMYQFPGIDMIILRRMNAPWFVKMNRSDILLSGERIIRKSDLTTILKDPVQGYELEVATNKYMQENGKNAHWMPSSAINIPKMKKNGIWTGLLKEIQMFVNIVLYLGVISSFKQIVSFCTKKLEMKEVSVLAK